MRTIRTTLLPAVGILAFAVAGCKTSEVNAVSSPYSSGKVYTEPVFYNGKHYEVALQFDAASNSYAVNVSGKGRDLGGTPGDQTIVQDVASSAIRHFACPVGQKGVILPGSARHTGAAWQLTARCT